MCFCNPYITLPIIWLIIPKYFSSHRKYLDYEIYSKENNFCEIQCLGTSLRDQVCNNTESEEDVDPVLTLVSYTIIRLINGVTLGESISSK